MQKNGKLGTTLIARDLKINILIKDKLSRNRRVKVFFFPGEKLDDLHHSLVPLLTKKQGKIIIQVEIRRNLYR